MTKSVTITVQATTGKDVVLPAQEDLRTPWVHKFSERGKYLRLHRAAINERRDNPVLYFETKNGQVIVRAVKMEESGDNWTIWGTQMGRQLRSTVYLRIVFNVKSEKLSVQRSLDPFA